MAAAGCCSKRAPAERSPVAGAPLYPRRTITPVLGGTMRHTTAALAAALLITLTACSSSSDDRKPAMATPPASTPAAKQPADGSKEALEKAVRAYSAAYFKPDTTAGYAMLSARCKEQLPAEVYGPLVESTVKQYGHQEIRSVKVDLVSGDTGLVSYSYDVPALDQPKQKWARESGVWRYDAC